MLTVPAAIVLFVLRRPLIGLLLQHGEYTALDALVTSRALAGFALGLPAFSVYLFALRGFYAHQDTRTPFVINAGQCILNVVFALLLYGRWGVLGLGAAFALSYALAALWALSVLATKVRGYPCARILESIARVLLAGVLAGEAGWWVARQVGGNSGADALAQDRRRQRDHPRGLRRRAVRARCARAHVAGPARSPPGGRHGVDLLGSAPCSTSSRSGGST